MIGTSSVQAQLRSGATGRLPSSSASRAQAIARPSPRVAPVMSTVFMELSCGLAAEQISHAPGSALTPVPRLEPRQLGFEEVVHDVRSHIRALGSRMSEMSDGIACVSNSED